MYLCDRKRKLVVGSATSSIKTMYTGVLQGYGLGPLLLSTYVQLIIVIICKHYLQHHHWADDLQLCNFVLNVTPTTAVVKQL